MNGQARFKDVAGPAGVEDYGAGMSAAFLDYDNDGHLDIYTGNMWTAAGQRVTAAPGFKPGRVSGDSGDLSPAHTRQLAVQERGDGTFADVTLDARAEFGRWAWSSDAFDFDSDGWQDLYVVNGMFTRRRRANRPWTSTASSGARSWRSRRSSAKPGTPYDDGWRATNRLLVSNGAQAQHERNVLLRNNGQGGFDEVSGSAGLDIDQDGRSFAVFDYDADGDPDVVADGAAFVAAAPALPQRLCRRPRVARAPPDRHEEQPRRDRCACHGRDRREPRDAHRHSGLRVHLAALQGTAVRPGKEQADRQGDDRLAERPRADTVRSSARIIASDRGGQRLLPHRAVSGLLRRLPSARTAGTNGGEPRSAETWLYEPFPAPVFTLRDLDGQEHSLAGLAGRPGADSSLGHVGAALARGASTNSRGSARRWRPRAPRSSPSRSIRRRTRRRSEPRPRVSGSP